MTRSRIDRLRDGLREREADAFVCFSPPAIFYLTGFRGSTAALVVGLEEAHFLCDFRYTEQAHAQVRDCEVHEMPGVLEARAGERLNALGAKRTVYDPAALTVSQLNLLQGAYPGTLQPSNDLPSAMRMVKDADEVALLRAASELAEGALLDVVDQFTEGMTERATAALLAYEFQRRGADGVSFDPIVLFGARSSLPHGRPTDRALKRGDIVLIDCGCLREGYCSDLTRTFYLCSFPGAWFEEVYAVTLRAQLAGVAEVRAGVMGRDVDAVARDIIGGAGHAEHFGHGLGHGVGVEVHESPRLNTQSETVLEPGMVVTVEPGIYLPGQGGVRIEDLVVVTDTGCEVLTKSNKELRVIGL